MARGGVADPVEATLGGVMRVAPNEWFGEADCVVGPFWRRGAAEAFAGLGVDFGHLAEYGFSLVHLGDEGWFVIVQRGTPVEA